MKYAALPSEFKALADSVGEFIQYFGFKKIHGRIWCYLYLSKEPMAAVELCRHLKVSKTLLSFSIADLLKYQVIQEAGKGPRRTVYYKANPDVAAVIFNVLKNREFVLLSKIHSKFAQVTEAPDAIDEAKVKNLGDMIVNAKSALEALLSLTNQEDDLQAQFAYLSSALEADPISKSAKMQKAKRTIN